MRLGSPGFIGDRLRQGRLALKLTQTQLAELIEKKPNTISAYEADKITPTDDVLSQLSVVLGQPIEYFFKPLPRLKRNAIFYRSMKASTKTARDKAEARLEMLREIHMFMQEYIEFPHVVFPDYPDIPEDPRDISFELIEKVAAWVRNQWGLGEKPIPNLIRLLESKGAIIAFDNLDESTLDALSEWGHPEKVPYFLLNREVESAVRLRLNLAHELGHMFLHRYMDKTLVERTGEMFDLIESQAFYFAGAFLMPMASIKPDLLLINFDRLKLVKRKWKVSIAAILMRAKNLDMIDEEYSKKLWKSMAQKGWRRKEPYDDEFPLEEPNTLRIALETLVKEDVFLVDEFESELSIGKRYLSSLCGLNDNFFQPVQPEFRVIKFSAG